jgi:hypothetical protein
MSGAGGMAQAVEYLICKQEALNSNSNHTKNLKKEGTIITCLTLEGSDRQVRWESVVPLRLFLAKFKQQRCLEEVALGRA